MGKDLFRGVVLGAVVSTVVMMTATAMAGTGVGALFNLGKTNTVNKQSTLKGATGSTARTLQLTNTGPGSGLGITVQAGKSPIVVNATAGKARNLNADKLDGVDSAQLRFIQMPVTSANLVGGATFSNGWGPYSGIRLPNSGVPEFSCAFVVPPTYTPGAKLTVRLVWHAAATTGGIVLAPAYLSVTRPGLTYIAGPGVRDGLTAVGGTVLSVPATADQCGEKLFEITSPDGVTSLQPGDAVGIGLYRSTGSVNDTCTADLVISGISVTF